jgi:hypothetical protein
MTWRLVAASVEGTSHAANNTACQDSNWASPTVGGDVSPVLCAFAADGAGTASNGRDGAELAMETVARFMRCNAGHEGFVPDEATLRETVLAVREVIANASEAAGLTTRDFACTLLGVVSTPTYTGVVQIGDGGVVVDVGDGLVLPIVPMSGEYANMTYFVTDEDALERMQVITFPATAQRLAVFTDGVQRLAVNMATNTPHEPFFSRFFRILAATHAADEERLHDDLVAFLRSAPVAARTDDDLTLILASLTP